MPRRAVTLRAVTTLFLERQHLAQPQASALTAAILPVLALLFILSQEHRSSVGPALPSLAPNACASR